MTTQTEPTILGAIWRHRHLAGAIVLGCGVLGALAGTVGSQTYKAEATMVVEDPRSGSQLLPSRTEPAGYVNQAAAILTTEVLAKNAAAKATEQLRAAAKQEASGSVSFGAASPITVQRNGTVELQLPNGRMWLRPNGVVELEPGRVLLNEKGQVLRPDGSPVPGPTGEALQVSADDQVIARSDGYLIVIDSRGGRLVVGPDGKVVTAGAPGAAAQSGDVLTGASSDVMTLRFGDKLVTVPGQSRATLTRADGAPLTRPQLSTPIGPTEKLLVVTTEGTAAGLTSAGQLLVVEKSGATSQLSEEMTVIAESDNSAANKSAQGPALEYEKLTADDLRAGLAVTTDPESSLIELSFQASTPEVAMVGANALVAAYQDQRRVQASGDSSSEFDRIETAIRSVNAELGVIDRDLAAARASTSSRTELQAQYESLIEQLALATRAGVGPANRDRVLDLRDQLDTVRAVIDAGEKTPKVNDLNERKRSVLARLAQLEDQRGKLQFEAKTLADDVVLFSPAQEAAQVGLGSLRLALVGLVLGLAPAAAVAYVRELRKPKLESASAIEGVLGVPLLAEIPDYKHERLRGHLPVLENPDSHVAEAYRFGAAAISIDRSVHGGSVLGVVSASVGEGKTSLVANLSLALAQTQPSLVAIDADLEGQVLSLLLERATNARPSLRGLADVLRGRGSVNDVVQYLEFPNGTAISLVSGGAEAAQVGGLFGTRTAREFFDDVGARYETALVDVPPLLSVAYAAKVIRDLDAVIVVVPHRMGRRDLEELKDRLAFVGVPVAGFIYTRTPLRQLRTSSVAALQYDLGGKPTDRKKWSKRLPGVRVGS